jgi:hypothetical protein
VGAGVRWRLSWRADPRAREIADRHYNRQSVGADQFVPPGRCLVLLTEEAGALWITSFPMAEYVHHAWPGAWMCTAFRNERRDLYLSSELIREAVAATRWEFGDPPARGMVTFVDTEQTKKKRDPGRCYLRAGFRHVGETKAGLVALQLAPEDCPPPLAPLGAQLDLVGGT